MYCILYMCLSHGKLALSGYIAATLLHTDKVAIDGQVCYSRWQIFGVNHTQSHETAHRPLHRPSGLGSRPNVVVREDHKTLPAHNSYKI